MNQRHRFMVQRWKRKSANYPRYKNSEDVIEADIFRSMKKGGVDFSGKSVLDVGCGTGVYTIRVAKESASVTGVDISKEMLAILREDADREGCSNIDIVNRPWDLFPTDEKKWDIAMSTMTPAVQTEDDYERVAACAKEAVIYLGWGGRRDVEIIRDIIAKSSGETRMFNNSLRMRRWLESKNIPFYSEIFDEERSKNMNFKEALAYCADELEAYSVKASKDELSQAAMKFTDKDGNVSFNINVKLELIIYKK